MGRGFSQIEFNETVAAPAFWLSIRRSRSRCQQGNDAMALRRCNMGNVGLVQNGWIDSRNSIVIRIHGKRR